MSHYISYRKPGFVGEFVAIQVTYFPSLDANKQPSMFDEATSKLGLNAKDNYRFLEAKGNLSEILVILHAAEKVTTPTFNFFTNPNNSLTIVSK